MGKGVAQLRPMGRMRAINGNQDTYSGNVNLERERAKFSRQFKKLLSWKEANTKRISAKLTERGKNQRWKFTKEQPTQGAVRIQKEICGDETNDDNIFCP